MSRIIYPALTQPVLTAAQRPEQVTESRWHQPLAGPVLRVGLPLAVVVASGIFAPVLTTAQFRETVTEDRWHQPLSTPVLRGGLSTAMQVADGASAPVLTTAQFPEQVAESRWHRPLSEPVLRGGLSTAVQTADGAVWSGFTPGAAVETITLDKWHQPLAQPRAKAPAQYPALVWAGFTPTAAETVTLDKWLAPLSQPAARAPQQYPGLTYSYAVLPAPLDGWQRPLSEPTRAKASFAAFAAGEFLSPSTPLPTTFAAAQKSWVWSPQGATFVSGGAQSFTFTAAPWVWSARAATFSLPVRPFVPPVRHNIPPGQEDAWRIEVARKLNALLNQTAAVILTPGATTTTLTDRRIGMFSHVTLSPKSASAATALASVYIVPGNGSAVIHHPSSAASDMIFSVLIV